MHYPGSPSISPDTQKRILGMFQQSLELTVQGKAQEARLGCDFILRMDGDFEPARVLRSRIDASGGGTVEVFDLIALASPAATPPPMATVQIPLPSLEAPSAPAPGANALAAGLEDLLAKRQLKRLVQVAEENRQEVAADPRLRKITETAYSLMEAEPYVRSFLDNARAAFQRGDVAEAGRNLAKARSLDAAHPELLELERAPIPARPPSPSAPANNAAPAWEMPLGELPDLGSGLPSLEDFDAPVLGALSGSTDPRIQQLLDEGQANLDRGDVQAAIDAWSRIFLIDIDHDEAARRIEKARRLKAEGDRRVEEILHDGVVAMESGDTAQARAFFEQVLSLQPGHLGARDHLDSLDAGGLDGSGPGPTTPTSGGFEESFSAPGSSGPPLKEEILVPPSPDARAKPSPARSASGKRKPAPRRQSSRSRFVAIAAIVIAAVVLLGGFLWLNQARIFPNASGKSAAQQRDVLAEARSLYEKGKPALALRLLKGIKEGDPRYAEARLLLASWEKPQEQTPAVSQEPTAAPVVPQGPVTAEMLGQQREELERAQKAFDQAEYLLADSWLKRAAGHGAPLPQSAALLAAQTLGQLEPIQRQVLLFRQGEWERALPELWPLHQAQPNNRDIRRLMVDCYYNLAVRDLRRGSPATAAEKIREAAALRPDLKAVSRVKAFAETYTSREQDLLYRIFANHLEYRQ